MVSSLIQWLVVWNETGHRLCEVFVHLSRTATVTENKRFLGTLNINIPANYAWHIFMCSKSQVLYNEVILLLADFTMTRYDMCLELNVCKIYPVVAYHIKTDICASVSHKFY